MKLRRFIYIAVCTLVTLFGITNITSANYLYKSSLGYSLQCPEKPVGVIPASVFYHDDRKGEVLVFANDGYAINRAWIILPDGFENSALPDLDNLKQNEVDKLLATLRANSAYEFVDYLPIAVKTRGILAVTAKEIEIDTDGDGVTDEVAKADTQMVITFFRSPKGTRYAMELIDNPELTQEAVSAYKMGLATFQEE
ncbi:hypothetical protein TAMA11512_14540 [Selenomonas sp. TAMA-11512]|uniref:hypothetical protein n=1 Tax=Selenomonas sp. TAMA-11512 TaxID=3095337 RepID=UPI0030930E15|nr:hypothetical protein TAMA11512_14540 [Selenomonas sp. TAMA-11512]